MLRDDVIGVASMDLRDADYGRVEWSEITRHDRLHRGRDVARDDDRGDFRLRAGAMRAAACDGDFEISATRHHRAGADLKFTDIKPRTVVHAKDRIARKAVEKPVLDHRLTPADPLLGGLEDEMHGTVEIAGFGEVARGTKKHRRVPVMSAGMHSALVTRAVR